MCLCIGNYMFNLKNLEHEVKNNLFLVSYKLSVLSLCGTCKLCVFRFSFTFLGYCWSL